MKQLLLLAAFLLFSDFPPQAEKAEKYIAEHRTQWYAEWRSLDVSPEMAEAVIWPEILRYSVIRDIIENTLNYSTYIRLGSSGFDFSVGRFQIRPSFAERLEKAWMKSGLASRYNIWFDTQDTCPHTEKWVQIRHILVTPAKTSYKNRPAKPVYYCAVGIRIIELSSRASAPLRSSAGSF